MTCHRLKKSASKHVDWPCLFTVIFYHPLQTISNLVALAAGAGFGHKMVSWFPITTVETDPPEITIAITNMDGGIWWYRTYPAGMNRIIKQGVRKERGKFVINGHAFEGLNEGRGYQINILNKDAGSILAQSPQFTLSSEDPSDTGPSLPNPNNQTINGADDHMSPGDDDDDIDEVMANNFNKTYADELLTSTSRDDHSRKDCARSTSMGPKVVRIVRRGI
ncbi:uncharacterized protein MELLADRAFT_107913 [Melampsora larici-populina 98AG31]|uniref:Uncharacterized protein n=1 Tax=Melampsora larici-populina (strain 98AG31 / pathotype 3-4-7) TaxID=747676 RepID=F4RRD2_MELLP|nr:uncharacterized protein MELLADRAFT_107913 [Melampsora larici-populina 98AG31]EGG05053.1 hypothetical protein MELLADRAFT_107913 [Melampsora larici-populina 98AG31]